MSFSQTDDILVSGAGIGGLTAALSLAKAGLGVTLIERNPHLEEAGAGIQLSPNASRVLVALGLGRALEEVADAPVALDVSRLGATRRLMSLPLQKIAERHGAPYLVLRRADLQGVLAEAVRRTRDVTLLTGRTIELFTAGPDGVNATSRALNDTLAEHQASALVGADGIWSQVRPLLGALERPFFTGYEAWRALLPADQVPGGIASECRVNLKLGRGCHLVHYPVSHGRFLNVVAVQHGRAERDGPRTQTYSHAGLPAELGGVIAQADPETAALLRAVGSWQVWSLYDMPPARMAQGPVALLGDAAHPILPFMAQGAALAIEDAAVLAARLAETGGDRTRFGAALALYARGREKRARKVRKLARKNGRTYHMGLPLVLARDRVMSLMGEAGMLRRYRWLYGWTKD